jgi:CRISPR-associated protein Cpf1
MHQQSSIFSEFTNLYSLTKTLRFELKPTETTKNSLDYVRDKERAKYYKKIKLLFDQLHREFIAKSLAYYESQNVDYTEFKNKYDDFLKTKQNKKKDDSKSQADFKTAKENFDKIKLEYRKKLVGFFNQYAENWKLEINQKLATKYPEKYQQNKKGEIKYCLNAKGIEVLTESGILEVLKLYLDDSLFVNEKRMAFTQEEKQEMLKGINFFDKFFTYFGPFNETRENFYKDDGTATAIATRIIDENLVRFYDNILLVNSQIKVGDKIFKPIEVDLDYNRSIFELNSFNKFVGQKGIDLYNGGEKGDLNLGQFNTLISKYIQDTYHQNKKLLFKNLYKIMLSEKTALFEEETAESCIEILNEVNQKNLTWLPKIEANLVSIFENKENNEFLEKIYLKKEALNELSSRFFGGKNWFVLEEVIKDLGYSENKDKNYKSFLPIITLKEGLESLENGTYQSFKLTKKAKKHSQQLFESETKEGYKIEELFRPEILAYYNGANSSLWLVFVDLWKKDFEKSVNSNLDLTRIGQKELFDLAKYEPLKETNYSHKYQIDGKEVSKIQTQANLAKLFLDSCMRIWQEAKMFELVKVVSRKPEPQYEYLKLEEAFYEIIKDYFGDFELFKQYDKIRNFSTRKPVSTSKFKINFENSTLLAGWDLNKEPDNTSVILKSPIGYELIVMNTKSNKVFDKVKNPELYDADNQEYQKMEYKLLSNVSRSIPKSTTQLKDVINHFRMTSDDYFIDDAKVFNQKLQITREEFELNNRIYLKSDLTKSILRDKDSDSDEKLYVKLFQKGYLQNGGDENIYKAGLFKWINFCKRFLNSYTSCEFFDFSKLKDTEEYSSSDQFYRDVDNACYSLNFVSVNNDVLLKLETEGKIYRYQIKNKDWNEFAKGSKNLQTIYWEQLFSPENLANNIIKLNGEAEIFRRPKTPERKFEQKKDNSGRLIFKGKTDKKVVDSERYSDNRMFFHVPITINFSAQEITKYNEFLEKTLPKDSVNYLGIDRGENHLLYYSLVNSDGEIIEKTVDGKDGQGSLNKFNGVDYEKLLHQRQEAKKDAQDKWSAIGNIKELKAGYLSLAVHEICKLAFENNALVILENLNFGFKKSRTIKFEKSVYQKFEVALANKLQHLVFKDKEPSELGGILNAVQLVPKLDKVTDLDKSDQWGIIKYVQASYTSRICPLTGWHKTIYLKDTELEIKKEFNPEADYHIRIGWDGEYKCYTFSYDSKIEKVEYCTLYLLPILQRSIYKDKKIDIINGQELHEKLNSVLNKFIDKDKINEEIWDKLDEKQWKIIKYVFDQLCNIRVKISNSEGKKEDVIQCPIAFEYKGEKIFFDSRKAVDIGNKIGRTLPVDGDANGAYHIAKRGIEMISKDK